MFSFTKTQDIIKIGNISLGGQPGQLPTVLFGGLFFSGNPDLNKAEEEIKEMYNISNRTGNPAIPDFFIKKNEYIDDIICFIQQHIPSNAPFSIDVTDPEVKINVLQKLDDENLLNRTIYNSIHVGITEDELLALKEHTPHVAILVAFNPKDTSPDGKIEVLENGAHIISDGLFDIAKTYRINNVLVDTAALAPGQNSGASIAAIPVLKEEYGIPTGCAIHNVVEKSNWLNKFSDQKPNVDSASNINISVFGGDFAIYGPLKHAPKVFPIMAWQDILVSEYTENYFGVEPVDYHPRRKMFE